MTEDQLRTVELWLDSGDEAFVADVLVAAIVRVGQLGRPAAEALATRIPPDPEIEAHWDEGADWLVTVLDGELAK